MSATGALALLRAAAMRFGDAGLGGVCLFWLAALFEELPPGLCPAGRPAHTDRKRAPEPVRPAASAPGGPTSGGRPVQTSCTPCRLCRLFKPFKTTENKTLEFRSREVGDVLRPIKLIGIRKEPVQHGEKGGIFNV
jgi:hypothetical protein